MSKTLVLDINELYHIVPEAKDLEGRNFKNVGDLLKDLIQAVELSGKWEFIQYVNNKPSLFVIRESKSIQTTQKPTSTGVSKTKLKELQDNINNLTGVVNALSSSVAEKTGMPIPQIEIKEIPIQQEIEVDPMDVDLNVDMFGTKVPWKK